jgi:hypothetical protein
MNPTLGPDASCVASETEVCSGAVVEESSRDPHGGDVAERGRDGRRSCRPSETKKESPVSFSRADTVSVVEAELLDKVAHADSASVYLSGTELRRARKLARLGLLEQGALGERYFKITDPGRTFVANRNRCRA